MSSRFYRGDRIFAKLKNVKGEWIQVATGFARGDEDAAEKWIEGQERKVAAAIRLRDGEPDADSMTVREYAEPWLRKRQEADLDWKNDTNRLERYILPVIGKKPIASVRAKDLIALFHKFKTTKLETTGELPSPRLIYNVYSVVSAMFRDAELDDVIAHAPAKLDERQLGPLVDADPEWRSGALFTRDEAVTLVSDERIPLDRRICYALGLLAGLRPGEMSALRWNHYDSTLTPLGRLLVAFSHNTRKNRTKSTKTEAVRMVPVHVTLAALLAEWKLGGWAEMVGRQPEPTDLLLPLPPIAAKLRRTREGEPIRTGDYMGKCWRERDLPMLGWRSRELYATKSTFITLAIEDGADPEVIKNRVTHTKAKRDAFTGYDRGPHWIATCAEVSKLNVYRLGASLVHAMAAGGFSDDESNGERWRRRESKPSPVGLHVVRSQRSSSEGQGATVMESDPVHQDAPNVVQAPCDVLLRVLELSILETKD